MSLEQKKGTGPSEHSRSVAVFFGTSHRTGFPDQESSMSTHKRYSRRRLLGQALGAAAAGIALPHFLACRPTTTPSGEPLPSSKRVSPNEEIRVGIIGCGRRNGQLVIGKGGQGAPPPEARIVAVADFNKARAEQWARTGEPKRIRTIVRCSTRKMWTSSSMPRRSTGITCPASMLARPASTCMASSL